MKSTLLLGTVFVLLALAEAKPQPKAKHSRGCIYILGNCARECEEGTHAYAIGCGFAKSERTCDSPESSLNTRGMICDLSRCDCDEPTVKDISTGKCVLLENCPKKDKKEGEKTETAKIEDDTGDRV